MNNENKVLEFIIEYKKKNNYPPTVREICSGLKYASTSTAKYYLDKLEKQGKISREKSKNRAIEIVSDENSTDNVLSLDVIGTIAAGTPITAYENVVDTFYFSSHLFKGYDMFCLRVKGESMINIGICNGDYVVVSKQSTAQNGEIVVAMIDSEATVKRFFKENGIIRLQPENNFMEPIYAKNVTILGKVVGLIRNNIK